MCMVRLFFFFNDTATTEIYTLSLHDALPIYQLGGDGGVVVALGEDVGDAERADPADQGVLRLAAPVGEVPGVEDAVHVELVDRSEEHTSELQSRQYLVCRLLLEKKKNYTPIR